MPAQSEVQRLLLQVEASVELARRNMKDLANAIDHDTTRMDENLRKVENGHKRMGQQLGKTGQFRGGMQQLSFQIGDVAQQMSLGTKASVIFAQQSGQVIQAIQLMNTGTSGWLKFLAGPWGIALTTAGVVLASFAGKLFETGDETTKLVDKMREQADQAAANERANKVWEQSIDGVRAAQKKLKQQIDDTLKSQVIQEQQDLDKAREGLQTQQAALDKAKQAFARAGGDKALAAAQAAASNPNTAGQSSYAASSSQAAAEARVAALVKLRDTIKQLEADIKASEETIRSVETRNALSTAEASASATTAIQRQSEALKGMLTISSQAGKITATSLEAAVTALERYQQAQAEAASEGVKFNQVGASREVGNLTKELARGHGNVDSYVKRIQALTKALTDAAAAAKKAKGAGAGDLTDFVNPVGGGPITGTFGEKRPGHTHAGIDIAKPVGTQVSAAAAGTVIEIGNLPGYGNTIVIDHGRGTTTRYAHLSKILAAKGDQVTQGQAIGLSGGAKGAEGAGNSQGPHLHFEVRRGGKPVDPRKGPFPTDPAFAGRGAIASADRLADRRQNQDDAFASAMQQLEQQALSAQMELVQGIDQQAKLAMDMVDAEQKRYELGIQNDVNDGRLREEQGKLLIEKAQAVSTQRKANIQARASLEKQEETTRTQNQELEQRMEALRYQDEIARSTDAHRRIQLEIIDLLYKQREADLRIAKAKAEAAGKAEEAARLQDQIDELPAQRSRDRDRAERGTMNPLEAWMDSVPQSAGEINDAFMQISANGLDALSDGIAGVISGSQSLGDMFRQVAAGMIADIARVIAKMLIMKALMAATNMMGSLPGGAGSVAGPGGLPPAPGWLGSFDTMPVSLGSGLGVTGTVGFASGGFVRGAGSGTSDSIPAMLSNGEFVMNSPAVQALGLPFLNALNSGHVGPKDFACNCGDDKGGGGLFSKLGFLGGFGGMGILGMLGGGGMSGLLGTSGGLFSTGTPPSPFGLMGKLFHFAEGGPVGRIPVSPRVAVPRPANHNGPLGGRGDTYHLYVQAANTGDPRKDHQSALQQGAAIRRQVARTADRGQ